MGDVDFHNANVQQLGVVDGTELLFIVLFSRETVRPLTFIAYETQLHHLDRSDDCRAADRARMGDNAHRTK